MIYLITTLFTDECRRFNVNILYWFVNFFFRS